MANQEQLEILKQGVEAWHKWMDENPGVKANLQRADLRGANLFGVYLLSADFNKVDLTGANLGLAHLIGSDFAQANLEKANFWGADLRFAKFGEAQLVGSDFKEANLKDTIFVRANLLQADFSHAELVRARFKESNLTGTNFWKSYMGGIEFSDNDLSASIGLDSVIHYAPSEISFSTVKKSKGKIPVEFLRGCGFSDLDIEYTKLANPELDSDQVTEITYKIHQLYLGGGIQYYSCFISYSSNDEVFAQRLHNDLQNNGVRCWFAPEDMKIGDQIRPRIDQEIRLRDKLLVILSENSVKSEWVGDEVEAALEEEKASDRLVLFPIRLDDAVMETRDDWAAKIKRRRHIGDFSNWRNEGSYQRACERLLRDLKA